MEAAIITGHRTATTDARYRRMHSKHCMNMISRSRLGIPETEETTCLGGFTY